MALDPAILGIVVLLIAAEFALRVRYRRYVMPHGTPAPGQIAGWKGDVPNSLRRSFLMRAGATRADRLGRRLGLLRLSTRELTPWIGPRCPNIHPVLLTMTPLAPSDVEGVAVRAAIYPAYNDAIRLVASRNGLPLVELAAGAPSGTILPDGFHLAVTGQEWVARQAFEQLAAAGIWRNVAGSNAP